MSCFCALFILAFLGSVSDTLWIREGEGYVIKVHYPQIAIDSQFIGDRLEEYVTLHVDGFLENCQGMCYGDVSLEDWVLEMNFDHEPSPDGMVCIMGWLWSFTGGAHGNPWTRAFIFDLETGSALGPVQLLGGQERFEVFVEKVHAELDDYFSPGSWYQRGASAEERNYNSVLPVPDENCGIKGYRVIFPPYQVEGYACGTLEFFISAELLDSTINEEN